MTQTVLLGDLVEKGWLTYGDGNYSSKYPKASELLEHGEIPFISGKNLKSGRISRDGMRYITPRLHAELKKGHIKPKDTLLVTRAGVGAVAYVSSDYDDANINAQLVFLRPDGTNIDHNFLFQLLSSDLMRQRLMSHSSGSAQGQLPIKSLLSIKLDLPDIETQKKIANILGTIDEKIQLNRKMNETLEQMGQALFRHYFIDNPEANKWDDGTVADLGKVITGKTPSKSKAEYYGGDVMFLKVPDMHGQSIIIKTEDMLSSLGADSQGNKYIPKWSTCVSCIATVGVVSLVGRQLQTNQQINSIVPKNRSYALFNYYLLKSKSETLKTMASGGSATPNLNKGYFERIKIKVPPIELLGKFQNESENLLYTVDANTHQIQTLTMLRDTLLPRLINGKVKVM